MGKYNFDIEKIDLPHFQSEQDRTSYNMHAPLNAKLGESYVTHAPFVIFHIKKKQDSVAAQLKQAGFVDNTLVINK